MTLQITAISFKQAKEFIAKHHSHHTPPVSWKFGCGVIDNNGGLHGVITAGRPVARLLDDGSTIEVTRCCTDKTPHAASMLYAAIRRAAKALGYSRIITYTLSEELGTSLKAAGWIPTTKSKGGSWNRNNRPRNDPNPTSPKQRWECELRATCEGL